MEADVEAGTQATGGWLLSGGSGLLGTALARSLAAAGTGYIRLIRGLDARPDELSWRPGAAASGSNPVSEPARLEGLRAAVHLSGANIGGRRWTASYRRELIASRVETTAALSRALAGLRQPPHVLVVASAVGMYGSRGDELLAEDASAGTGFLAGLCQQWEAAAEPARAAGIRVVHARLGVILAPEGGALARMLPPFRLGLGGRLGDGRQWMSWVALEDAVRAIRFAVDKPELAGGVNVVAPEPVTNRVFTAELAAALGRPAVFPAPAPLLRLAFGQMAEETLLASQRAVPERLVAAGFRFARPTVRQALDAALSRQNR